MRRTTILAALLLAPLSATACHDSTGPAAGPAAAVVIAGGDGQTGPTNTRLRGTLEVKVTDAAGRPVRGVHVAWAVDPLGGSLDTHESVTDGRGIAGANWGVGAYGGTWTVTATVAGLPPVLFHATAAGPVTLTLIQPLPGDTVDSLNLVVAMRGASPPRQVEAWMGDTKFVLRPDGQGPEGARFRLDLPLSGTLAEDHAVRVYAGDSAGHVSAVATHVVHDASPQLGLPEPAPCKSGPALLGGATRVVATCSDDDGGCRGIAIAVNGRVLASGRDSAVAAFPASTLPADSVRFTLQATGAHGVVRTVDSKLFRVERSPRFTLLARVNGYVLDGDDERVLYDVAGPTLGASYSHHSIVVRDLATGADTIFASGVASWSGAVTRSGAIAEAFPNFSYFEKIHGVWLYGPGAKTLASSRWYFRARDDWVAWISGPPGGPIDRTAVATGSRTSTTDRVDIGTYYALADDGTIAYPALSQGVTQIFVMRPDGTVEQVTHDTATMAASGQAEGDLVVYDRYNPGPSPQHRVVLLAPDGEHLLTAPSATAWTGSFTLRGGYVLLAVDTAGAREFRVRTPDGRVVRLGDPVHDTRAHASLGFGGAVVVGFDARLYYAVPPDYQLRDVSGDYGSERWHRGRLYETTCNALFRIDP